MRRFLFMFLIILTMAAAAHAASGIDWRSHGDAMPEASKTDKPVVIHFTADWCTWCTKMKKETYTDPEVARLLKDEFVTAMVNSDDYPLLSFIYGVQSLPTIWIVDSHGGGITKISGYKDARSFARYLNWVASDSWSTQSFSDFTASEG